MSFTMAPLTANKNYFKPYSTNFPEEMLTSFQFISSRLPKKVDFLELTQNELSQLTNKSEEEIRRSGYLGEVKEGYYEGPNADMFDFFHHQFDQIAPVDGEPESISVYDLVEKNLKLPKAKATFWQNMPKDVKTLVQEFQCLLTSAGKQNGELTLEDLGDVISASKVGQNLLLSMAIRWITEFKTIAAIAEDKQVITIQDLLIRNRDCPKWRGSPPPSYWP